MKKKKKNCSGGQNNVPSPRYFTVKNVLEEIRSKVWDSSRKILRFYISCSWNLFALEVFGRSYRQFPWTFNTFFYGRDMVNESTITPKSYILCVAVKADFFKFNTNPCCWRRKTLCLWSLTLLHLHGLSAACPIIVQINYN